MKRTIAITMFIIACATQCVRAGILAGPITNSANAHIYYLLTQTNWVSSEQQAKSMGGHLARIDDAAEQLWVYSTFSAYGGVYRDLWIGLNDRQVDGNFRWAGGGPVTYTNWSPGEPNGGTNENAVHMWSPSGAAPGKWNDLAELDVLANSGPNGVVEVGPMTLAGRVTNSANGHIYYLLATDTWESSEAAAVRLGGHLATINDQAEQDWVFSTFNSWEGTNASLWIGLREVGSEGNYQWVSGEPLNYTYWGAGEPNNNFGGCGGESYVQMVKANNGHADVPGMWNDIASPTQPCFTDFDPVHGVVEIATEVKIQVSQVAVSWNSVLDINYQVQFALAVNPSAWTNLGVPVVGTGSNNMVFDSVLDQPKKFYRVISVP